VNQPQAASWQLPPAMADTAPPIDSAYNFIYWFSVVFTVAITGAMLYFVVKYKRRKGVKSEPTGHFNRLELFWTITPTIFIVVLFHVAFTAYIHNATAAEGATEIRVRAKKWSWEFEYPSGDRVPSELHLEVGRPYKMIISSDDVLHSFYIPEFRMKRDAVPGQYSFIAFTPTVVGPANVFCAEYCGTSHSGMLATVIVETPEDHKKFLDSLGKQPEICGDPPGPCTPERWGGELFVKNACPTCHGPQGSGMIAGSKTPGPALAGIFGHDVQLTTGSVVADENYIRESILRPNAKIVAGYTNVQMPAFVFKDDQLDALIAYIKSLKQ
jgi:cytochrome c oxidase subunit II